LRRLAALSSPPGGSYQKPRKTGKIACVAWRQFITRQAVSGKIPKHAKFNKIDIDHAITYDTTYI